MHAPQSGYGCQNIVRNERHNDMLNRWIPPKWKFRSVDLDLTKVNKTDVGLREWDYARGLPLIVSKKQGKHKNFHWLDPAAINFYLSGTKMSSRNPKARPRMWAILIHTLNTRIMKSATDRNVFNASAQARSDEDQCLGQECDKSANIGNWCNISWWWLHFTAIAQEEDSLWKSFWCFNFPKSKVIHMVIHYFITNYKYESLVMYHSRNHSLLHSFLVHSCLVWSDDLGLVTPGKRFSTMFAN